MESRNLKSVKSTKLTGQIEVPGDKSLSHRALIFASQTIGQSKISGLLESEDVLNTKKSLKKLGVKISKSNNQYVVDGVGLAGFSEPDNFLDFGNSGTGSRLMMGVLATQKFRSFLTGDDSLRGRPMKRVTVPLTKMGAEIDARAENFLPALIKPSKVLLPIQYELPVASAQVKSAILLAAMNVAGTTTIIESEKTRDHTELLMKYFDLPISVSEENGKNIIKFTGQKEYKAKNIIISGDPSSAAFAIVAAIITPDSEITVKNILINPLRTGLFETLKEMGANIEIKNQREQAGELVADITARYSELRGVEVPANRAPSMIDEYPILGIAAACAKGETVMNGLAELRVKESNRLNAILEGLKACGIEAYEQGDSLIVKSGKFVGNKTIETHGDHRIAMSFLVAGLISDQPIEVNKPEMIATSFPKFVELMNGLGAKIS